MRELLFIEPSETETDRRLGFVRNGHRATGYYDENGVVSLVSPRQPDRLQLLRFDPVGALFQVQGRKGTFRIDDLLAQALTDPAPKVLPVSAIESDLADALSIPELEDEVFDLHGRYLKSVGGNRKRWWNKLHRAVGALAEACEMLGQLLVAKGRSDSEFWRVYRNAGWGERVTLYSWVVLTGHRDDYRHHLVGADWYQEQKRWKWRDGDLPRRRPLGNRALSYSLFPRGMQRTLFGSYTLYINGFRDLTTSAGPRPIGDENEGSARKALEETYFPPTLSEKMGAGSRTNEHLCDRLLNGMFPQGFRREHDRYLVDLDWNDCEFGGVVRDIPGGPYHLPNLSAELKRADDTMVLQSISIQYRNQPVGRVDEPDNALGPKTVVTPGDPLWERAKTVLRGSLVLDAQLDLHLARGHLLCELVRVALERSALGRGAKVYDVLAPHLDGVDVINRLGDFLILEERGSLPVVSALTADAVGKRIGRAMGAYDWRGFEPREPLVTSDLFATAAKEFWRVCKGYVAQALPGDVYDDEVRSFSTELTRRSPPARRYRDRDAQWTHASELGAPDRERSISRMESSDDVRAFCAWVIFHATFFHTWVNDAQWDDAGEAAYAPLSLRGTIFDHPDVDLDTWWTLVRPSAMDEGYMKMIHYALTHFDMGYVFVDDLEPSTSAFRDYLKSELDETLFSSDAAEPRLRPRNLRSRLNS